MKNKEEQIKIVLDLLDPGQLIEPKVGGILTFVRRLPIKGKYYSNVLIETFAEEVFEEYRKHLNKLTLKELIILEKHLKCPTMVNFLNTTFPDILEGLSEIKDKQ